MSVTELKTDPYQKAHLDQMNPRHFFSDKEMIGKKIQTMVDAQGGRAATIFHNGNPIAILGYSHLWSGVAEVFSVITDDIVPVRFSFHQVVLGMIDTLQCSGYSRLQFTVREGYPRAERWAEGLGFEKEGVMRKYGPDQASHFLYARVV